MGGAGAVAGATGPTGSGAVVRSVVRVLGFRDVAQASISARQPTPEVLLLGAEVDAVHATSMVLLAMFRPAWRRAALGSASVAGTFALLGVCLARSTPRREVAPPPVSTTGRLQEYRDRLAALLAGVVLPGSVRAVAG